MEEEGRTNEELDQSSNQSSFRRSHSSFFRIPCGFFERSKRLFCSGVFLKGSAFVVGFWNPSKGFRAIMAIIVLLVDIYYFLYGVFAVFVCPNVETPLNSVNSWFCGNITDSTTCSHILHGSELVDVLPVISYLSRLMSNVAFFWCMWKLQRRSVYCVTLETAYSKTGRSIWAKLNCTMLCFGFFLLTSVLWFDIDFTESPYNCYIANNTYILPMWAILTSSWVFVIITNAMKDCVTMCHAEIRNAVGCSLDDVIRIHKHLCKQMSSTSESLKVWFVIHWFLLAITAVIYVASVVSFFKQPVDCFGRYGNILVSVIYLYVFVYPSYCAASVTTQCNRMLKELNTTTDEDWPTGHPFHNRSHLALFLHYAQYTNCGFQVIGEVTFGTNFAWLSAIITLCGLGVNVFLINDGKL